MAAKAGAGARLTWLGTGATLIALAFTVRPVQASAWVFVAVLLTGVSVLAVAFAPRRTWWPWRRDDASDRMTLAAECQRLAKALERLGADRPRERPRSLLGGDRERLARWRAETAGRYRSEYRPWALDVFDRAVACGAASGAARRLVDSPGGDQLADLVDLFTETAERLKG